MVNWNYEKSNMRSQARRIGRTMIKKQSVFLISMLLWLVLVFSACAKQEPLSAASAPGASQQAVVENPTPAKPVFPKTLAVEIRDFRFSPDEISVNRGDTVSWINQDSATHSVLIEGEIESPALRKFDTWNHTFAQPGTYNYRCGIHPSMVGTIVVQ